MTTRAPVGLWARRDWSGSRKPAAERRFSWWSVIFSLVQQHLCSSCYHDHYNHHRHQLVQPATGWRLLRSTMPPNQSPYLQGKRNMPSKNKSSASANGNAASHGSRTSGPDAGTAAHVPTQPLGSGKHLGATRRWGDASSEMSPYVTKDLWPTSHSSRPQQLPSSTSSSPAHTIGLASRMKPRHSSPAPANRPEASQTKPSIRRRSAADTVPPLERAEVQLVSDDDNVDDPTPAQAPPKTPVAQSSSGPTTSSSLISPPISESRSEPRQSRLEVPALSSSSAARPRTSDLNGDLNRAAVDIVQQGKQVDY